MIEYVYYVKVYSIRWVGSLKALVVMLIENEPSF